jgi:hypothetical protein
MPGLEEEWLSKPVALLRDSFFPVKVVGRSRLWDPEPFARQ